MGIIYIKTDDKTKSKIKNLRKISNLKISEFNDLLLFEGLNNIEDKYLKKVGFDFFKALDEGNDQIYCPHCRQEFYDSSKFAYYGEFDKKNKYMIEIKDLECVHCQEKFTALFDFQVNKWFCDIFLK